MLVNKICYSFNFPKNVREFRWKEDDRDTGNGRCKVSFSYFRAIRNGKFCLYDARYAAVCSGLSNGRRASAY